MRRADQLRGSRAGRNLGAAEPGRRGTWAPRNLAAAEPGAAEASCVEGSPGYSARASGSGVLGPRTAAQTPSLALAAVIRSAAGVS